MITIFSKISKGPIMEKRNGNVSFRLVPHAPEFSNVHSLGNTCCQPFVPPPKYCTRAILVRTDRWTKTRIENHDKFFKDMEYFIQWLLMNWFCKKSNDFCRCLMKLYQHMIKHYIHIHYTCILYTISKSKKLTSLSLPKG